MDPRARTYLKVAQMLSSHLITFVPVNSADGVQATRAVRHGGNADHLSLCFPPDPFLSPLDRPEGSVEFTEDDSGFEFTDDEGD